MFAGYPSSKTSEWMHVQEEEGTSTWIVRYYEHIVM